MLGGTRQVDVVWRCTSSRLRAVVVVVVSVLSASDHNRHQHGRPVRRTTPRDTVLSLCGRQGQVHVKRGAGMLHRPLLAHHLPATVRRIQRYLLGDLPKHQSGPY